MSDVVKIEFTEEEKWAIKYARGYADDVAGIEKFILGSQPRRFCIMELYKWFVRNKGLKKIEDLDIETKTTIYNDSKNIFPEQMDQVKRKQLCVFLYFMNYIFENYLS